MPSLDRPPKPALVFRVGVVGHRPDRLALADLATLSSRLHDVLIAVKAEVERFAVEGRGLFRDGQPLLRALSPLAEGTDRMFAELALQAGYELGCPMPFFREGYEKDFATDNPESLEPASLERFRSILAHAEERRALVTLELDGDRDDRPTAYGANGRVLVNQCDLLVVVWDGQRQGKRGGTEETLAFARERGVPTLWIDAQMPHGFELIRAESEPRVATNGRQVPGPGTSLEGLSAVVRQALELPAGELASGASKHSHGTTIADYYAERQWSWNLAPLWSLFKTAVGGGKRGAPSLRVTPYEVSVEQEWGRDRSSETTRIIDWLRPFYAWPDRLAVIYGDLYRSAFLAAFLMASGAVGMALLPLAFGWNVYEPHFSETVFVVAELALILGILVVVSLGRRRMWHERLVDYRIAAELVRHLRISAPLGSARPFPQTQAQLNNYGHPGATWMAWYVRAIERELWLPNTRLDPPHINRCLRDLEQYIDGQVTFHTRASEQSHRIEERLHTIGFGLLLATVAACLVHLVAGLGVFSHPPPWVLGTLTFFAGFLPALGAAFAGISNQGEFARVGKRSSGMRERLRDLQREVAALRAKVDQMPPDAPAPGLSRRATALAADVAQLMVNEVLDWRIVFLDRPLKEP